MLINIRSTNKLVRNVIWSSRNVVAFSSLRVDNKQTIANKKAELQAFEDGFQMFEVDIASAQANEMWAHAWF